MKFRLTSAHPVQARFEELCTKAQELGLNLEFYGGTLVVTDHLSEGKQSYNVIDIEGVTDTLETIERVSETDAVRVIEGDAMAVDTFATGGWCSGGASCREHGAKGRAR